MEAATMTYQGRPISAAEATAARNFRRWCLYLGVTRGDIAQGSGVSYSQVRELDRHAPSGRGLMGVARWLGVPAEFLTSLSPTAPEARPIAEAVLAHFAECRMTGAPLTGFPRERLTWGVRAEASPGQQEAAAA